VSKPNLLNIVSLEIFLDIYYGICFCIVFASTIKAFNEKHFFFNDYCMHTSTLINWLVIQRELMGLRYLIIRKNDRRNEGKKIYNGLLSTQSQWLLCMFTNM